MAAGEMTSAPTGKGLRRAPRLFAAAFVALLAAACATAPQPDDAWQSDRGGEILAEGFETIYDKYIQDIPAPRIAAGALAGLEGIDPGLDIAARQSRVRVDYQGVGIASYAAPNSADPVAWAALTRRAIDAARKVSPLLRAASAEQIYKAAFDGVLDGLDSHSRYAGLRSARDYRAQREGFGGIGVRLGLDGELPEIVAILRHTPASRSALKTGDVISHVNGESLSGLSRRDVIWMLRGPIGSRAELTIIRRGRETPLGVSLRRARIVSPTVQLERKAETAIITISGFNQNTGRELERVLAELPWDGAGAPKGIVLDLRSNPGGLLDQAVVVADAFLARGRIVSTRGRHPDSFQLFNASGRDLTRNVPLVVLINGQSASAAEIVAAALQDRGRAVVVGSNSYGKGTVQNITRLPNDGELILTWSLFHAPSGYALEHLGILPNICTSTGGEKAVGDGASFDGMINETATVLASWRASHRENTRELKTLRARCPKRSGKPKADMEVANRLLGNRALYARTLGISAPALAQGSGSTARTR